MTSPALPAPGTSDGPASFTASYTLSEAEQARANRYVTHRRWTTWAAYFVFALFLVIHWATKRRWRFDWSSIALTLLHWSKDEAMVVPKKALTPQQLDAFWWVVGRWARHLVRDSRGA